MRLDLCGDEIEQMVCACGYKLFLFVRNRRLVMLLFYVIDIFDWFGVIGITLRNKVILPFHGVTLEVLIHDAIFVWICVRV